MSVVQQHLSKAETARRYQVSWRWVHTLVTRYQTRGWEAVEPRSRRPHSNSRAVTAALRERICTLRCELQAADWTTARSRLRPGCSRKDSGHRLSPPSAVFSSPPGWSPRNRRSGPKAPIGDSKPTSPTNAGSLTSPTGSSPTAPVWRSSTGSMTTPATCSPAAPTAVSGARP